MPDSSRKRVQLARCIDHTLLRPDTGSEQIGRLCREAREWGFSTVCVHPCWVNLASRLLEGHGVGVVAVVGFPLGATATQVKVFEARWSIEQGASEIDAVLNTGALIEGSDEWVRSEAKALVAACHENGAICKMILEIGLLPQDVLARGCRIVEDAAADFVKTSTGFGPRDTRVEDVRSIKKMLISSTGIKAAGGIRDRVTALSMLDAGASRIGTSSGLKILSGGEKR